MNEMCLSAPIAATTFGVADNDWLNATAPRVAEYSNPGLKDATPFGVAGQQAARHESAASSAGINSR